jgi:hypothetical protein
VRVCSVGGGARVRFETTRTAGKECHDGSAVLPWRHACSLCSSPFRCGAARRGARHRHGRLDLSLSLWSIRWLHPNTCTCAEHVRFHEATDRLTDRASSRAGWRPDRVSSFLPGRRRMYGESIVGRRRTTYVQVDPAWCGALALHCFALVQLQGGGTARPLGDRSARPVHGSARPAHRARTGPDKTGPATTSIHR